MTGGWWPGPMPTLARSGHDRVAERRDDPAWLAAAWNRAQVLVVAPDLTGPVVETEFGPRLRLRPAGEAPADAPRYFLGEHDGSPVFAVTGPNDPEAERWAGLREVGAELDDLGAGLLTTAVALIQWHDRHPRCPLCGNPTESVRGGWTRRCPVDGSEHWPRVDPAVIMLVHDGVDRCVLGRQPTWPPGRYSILAGFVEPGESAEAAVTREVAEEVGLSVSEVRYAASQPWPFPSSLMLGFVARAVGDLTLRPVGGRLGDGELEHAGWFTREEIRAKTVRLPPPVSIARRLIDDWVAGRFPDS